MKRFLWGENKLQASVWLMPGSLVQPTSGAMTDVALQLARQVSDKHQVHNPIVGSTKALMTCLIMCSLEDLIHNTLDARNTEAGPVILSVVEPN
jgi:hypothetical protein